MIHENGIGYENKHVYNSFVISYAGLSGVESYNVMSGSIHILKQTIRSDLILLVFQIFEEESNEEVVYTNSICMK